MKLPRFSAQIIFTAVFLFAAQYYGFTQGTSESTLANLEPKDAISVSLGGYTTGLWNFFGNPALYFKSNGKPIEVFYNPWLYCGVFDGGLTSVSTLGQDTTSETMNNLVSSNGFGGGFSLGFGWTGKGIGLGIVALMDMYGRGSDIDHISGTLDGGLLAVLGYSFSLVNSEKLSLKVGGDVRPFIRFTGTVTGQDLLAYASLVSGRGSEAFMGIPVYAGASAELNLGLIVEAGSAFKAGVTVKHLAPAQLYTPTTVGVLLENFGFARGVGASVEYGVVPDISVGMEMHLLRLFGFQGGTDIAVVSEVRDLIAVFNGSLPFCDAFKAGLKLSFFKDALRCTTAFSSGLFSFGCGFTAWFLAVDISVFSEMVGAARQGIALTTALHF